MVQEAGYWADFAGALGAVVVALASVIAIVVAVKANQTARAALERDILRERSLVARQLQAWWVKWDDTAGESFGVVVSNAGDGATVFRSVEVRAIGNSVASRFPDPSIRFETLPPGTYLMQSPQARGATAPWIAKGAIQGTGGLTPLLNAKKWNVTRIAFTDPVGTAWEWTSDRYLRMVREQDKRLIDE